MSALAGGRRRPKSRGKAGYSLLEMLIVLSIIGLIAALVGPRLFAQLDKSKVTAARVQLKALKSALATMRLDIGRFPTEAEGLDLLVRAPGEGPASWAGPYLSADTPDDPWGRPYVYRPPAGAGQEPQVLTLGSDGKPGGEGDGADIFE